MKDASFPLFFWLIISQPVLEITETNFAGQAFEWVAFRIRAFLFCIRAKTIAIFND